MTKEELFLKTYNIDIVEYAKIFDQIREQIREQLSEKRGLKHMSFYKPYNLSKHDIIQIDSKIETIHSLGVDAKSLIYDLLDFLSEQENGKRKNTGYFEVDTDEYTFSEITY